MLCPVCKIDLVISEKQNIEIDYCPKCRGIWLDRGELDKIVERSAAAERESGFGSRDTYYDDNDNYKYQKGYKKRKSFLGDLFDF